jgi:predicted TIM-barrel fold metal-dependent hydrolase
MKMAPLVFRKMLDHPDFYPLYAELQELDVPLGIHHSGAVQADTGAAQYDKRMPLRQAACFPHDTMLAMGGLIYGGVLDRFPKLRVAFLECGCSWVPYWMKRLEQHSEFAEIGFEFPGMKKSVIEHMKGEQCYYHAESEEFALPLVLKEMGEEHFMYASDYPHFGDAITAFGEVAKWKQLDGIPESARRKVLGDNAARFYRLDS